MPKRSSTGKLGATPRRAGFSVLGVVVALVALAVETAAPAQLAVAEPNSRHFPPIVEGVPVMRLAKIAEQVSLFWSEPRPWDVRAALGSDRAANALPGRDGMTYNYGSTASRWVISLEGRFDCRPPSCSIPQTPLAGKHIPTPSRSGPVAVRTMILTVDPATMRLDGSFRLVNHSVDIAKLGHVWPLGSYMPRGSGLSPANAGPVGPEPRASAYLTRGEPSFEKVAVGASARGALQPVAYSDGQLEVPSGWPVVYPGISECETGLPPADGVVLLGAFGASQWCGDDARAAGQSLPSVANVVRLGPLPIGEPYGSLPKTRRNGLTIYTAVPHGPISGTVYLVPSLGVELMADGPDANTVLTSIRPSVRALALAVPVAPAPQRWRRVGLAGLSLAVPRTWPVTRTDLSHGCMWRDPIALPSPPQVVLDTDTNPMVPKCLGGSAGPPADGVVVHAGTLRAPNAVQPAPTELRLHGLRALVSQANPFFVLAVDVVVPGRDMPVEVLIGLGDPVTAARVLRSIAPA